MTLVPNGPRERLDYVVKTYRDTKNAVIVPDVIILSLYLMGKDEAARDLWPKAQAVRDLMWSRDDDLEHWPSGEGPYAWRKVVEKLFAPAKLDRCDFDREWNRQQAAGEQDPERLAFAMESGELVALCAIDEMQKWWRPGRPAPLPWVNLPDRHELDFLIPWMAKELGRLVKAIRRGNRDAARGRGNLTDPSFGDYRIAVGQLMGKAPAIAMWARDNNIDLSKTTLAEALEAIKTYEAPVDIDVPQGQIVYEWPDGWTVQELRTEQELEVEGDIMQHCVGGYCEEVEGGAARIYSLRDPRGAPHVTIEWRPLIQEWGLSPSGTFIHLVSDAKLDHLFRVSTRVWDDPVAFLASELTQYGRFVQIRGKQNEMPVEKYRKRVRDFINDRFHGNKLGLLMVGTRVSFAGETLFGIDFTDDFEWEGVPLENGDFSRATFVNCLLQYNPSMADVRFNGARFKMCRLGGRFVGCDFMDAEFYDCMIGSSALFAECEFYGARFRRTAVVPKRTDPQILPHVPRAPGFLSKTPWGYEEAFRAINNPNDWGTIVDGVGFESCGLVDAVFEGTSATDRYAFTLTLGSVRFERCDMASMRIGPDVELMNILRRNNVASISIMGGEVAGLSLDRKMMTRAYRRTGGGALPDHPRNYILMLEDVDIGGVAPDTRELIDELEREGAVSFRGVTDDGKLLLGMGRLEDW